MKLLILMTLITLTGCYRMPGDEDFSTVPATNNPSVTREKSGGFLPGMNI